MNLSFPLLAVLLGNLAIYCVHLPILIVVISLVYSATRFDPWPHILRETMRWVVRMAAFLLIIGVVLWILNISI